MQILHVFFNILSSLLSIVFRLFPINNYKVTATNFFGKGYGDSPKYIVDELLNISNKYKIVWLVSDRKEASRANYPKSFKLVSYFSIRAIYELTTSRVWIDNTRKKYKIYRRNKQYYFQTWHGGIPLKHIEMDATDTLSQNYIKLAKNDSKNITHFLSNSRFNTEVIKKVFWYENEILESGIPRCDILKYKKNPKLLEDLSIPVTHTIVLYAPTFKNGMDSDYHSLNYVNVLETFKVRLKKDVVLLVRFHPNTKVVSNLPDEVINVTSYPDMYELLSITDYLITDYSSTMFEFGRENKAVFLYLKDHQSYLNERRLYFELDKLPYPISFTEEELLENIASFNIEDYLRKNNTFNSFLDYYKVSSSSKYVSCYLHNLVHENEK
jgi:CDP-glycerol glycerophosphotransferase